MEETKTRWGLLAFVAVVLLLLALASLSPGAWASPAQKHPEQQTMPPVASFEVGGGYPGAPQIKSIWLNPGGIDWTNVVVTDDIDQHLYVDDVTVDCQPGPCAAGITLTGVGRADGRVRINIPTLAANTLVTVRIYVTILDTAPVGYQVRNMACVKSEEQEVSCSPYDSFVVQEVPFVPEAGSLALVGSGLAGLAGYATVKWRARR